MCTLREQDGKIQENGNYLLVTSGLMERRIIDRSSTLDNQEKGEKPIFWIRGNRHSDRSSGMQ